MTRNDARGSRGRIAPAVFWKNTRRDRPTIPALGSSGTIIRATAIAAARLIRNAAFRSIPAGKSDSARKRRLARRIGQSSPKRESGENMQFENGTFVATIAELRALTTYASADVTRPHIASVCFDTGRGCAVATDGHRLIKIDAAKSSAPRPNETTERNEHLVNAKRLQAALKGMGSKRTKVRVTPKDGSFVVECGALTGAIPEVNDAKFPAHDQVIPTIASMPAPAACVGFNAYYLAALGVLGEIAESHGCKTTGCQLRLSEELSPARIDAAFMGENVDDQGSATIVVMPMRI